MQVLGHGVAHESIGNFPGDDGVSRLAEGLQQCPNLQALSLCLVLHHKVGRGLRAMFAGKRHLGPYWWEAV